MGIAPVKLGHLRLNSSAQEGNGQHGCAYEKDRMSHVLLLIRMAKKNWRARYIADAISKFPNQTRQLAE
jgi:hypothetical protein